MTKREINRMVLREAKKQLGFNMCEMYWDGNFTNKNFKSHVKVQTPEGIAHITLPFNLCTI